MMKLEEIGLEKVSKEMNHFRNVGKVFKNHKPQKFSKKKLQDSIAYPL